MTDNNKLIEILKENNVRISKLGNICLNDLVDNVIQSKNSDGYIKKIPNKKIIKDNYYITPNGCIEILKNTNFRRCKDIYTQILIDDGDKSSIIDVEKQIFQFDGHKFPAFFVEKEDGDWEVYVQGSPVAKFLGYMNPSEAIGDHVDDENLFNYGQLIKLFPASTNLVSKKYLETKTLFINLSGFFNLIHYSKKDPAKKIKKWLDNEVIPSLIKYGTYTMQPVKMNIKIFYDDAMFSDFDKKAVLYIAFVGKYKGEFIFKYGLTRDVFRREYDEHRKQFEKFQVVFIGECDNCEEVETLFEKELKLRYLWRNLMINNKQQTELFTVTTKFNYDFFIDLMKKLITNNKLPVIKEADNKIANLVKVVDGYKQSDELRKQSDELRKLEMQFKLSDNYKLELERDVKIKQIESDTQIALGNINIELQREKNKQIAMEHDYDVTHFIDNVSKNKPNSKAKNIVKL